MPRPVIDSADLDPLEVLWASIHRNGRLPKFPVRAQLIYFDADRFRWWFRYGCRPLPLEDSSGYVPFDTMTLQQIRDWMDAQMREHPEQIHQ